MASNATQSFVPVQEVRNGTMILKNGGLRSVLMASSVNMALKSSDEQISIILQFQNFLNLSMTGLKASYVLLTASTRNCGI